MLTDKELAAQLTFDRIAKAVLARRLHGGSQKGHRPVIAIYAVIERILRSIERWAGAQAERWAYCSDCGRNRYTGRPCK